MPALAAGVVVERRGSALPLPGLGFGVWVLGFGVLGLGFGVLGFGSWVLGVWFCVLCFLAFGFEFWCLVVGLGFEI
jgi:hypothetical protein